MVAKVSGRPSAGWRREVEQQRAAVAAGELSADEAYAERLWPASFVDAIDEVLAAFEQDVTELGRQPSDERVWTAVQHVVEALNESDEEEGCIETDEREELAEYIDVVLTAAGVDVAALTGRRGLGRGELTDEWREW